MNATTPHRPGRFSGGNITPWLLGLITIIIVIAFCAAAQHQTHVEADHVDHDSLERNTPLDSLN